MQVRQNSLSELKISPRLCVKEKTFCVKEKPLFTQRETDGVPHHS